SSLTVRPARLDRSSREQSETGLDPVRLDPYPLDGACPELDEGLGTFGVAERALGVWGEI
ncbi:MAG: hypothetical protein KAS19_11895, partial [Anaerolineales bacterium]|nr:hypothetical protein [Anaerolineales bacterium]